jgi:DNA polymerase-4
MDRVILHCDLNNFFASVECLYRPELKNVPMAVGADEQSRRGIILAKNELAKKCGVVTAETIYQAKVKCPDLVLVPPRHDDYAEHSKMVRDIYECYSDRVEPFGIDEAWLDVTGSMGFYDSGEALANIIRKDVKDKTGLTISVGVSFNKTFAKLGSDYKKPDAVTVISKQNYQQILYPLPVTTMLNVGKSSAAVLDKAGITTIGHLANADKSLIVSMLGKSGAVLHDCARGLDNSEVQLTSESSIAKSIGKGMTFGSDIIGLHDVKRALQPLAEEVAVNLRKASLKCSAVQITIRNPQFITITRQKQLQKPTHLMTEILDTAMEIMKAQWEEGAPIRMLTVTAISLIRDSETQQLSIFDAIDSKDDKREKIEQTIDRIRDKYGKHAISLGMHTDKENH